MAKSHIEEIEKPWCNEAPFTKYLLHDGKVNGKPRFHCLDIWHCVHLGVGKSWIASGALELQKLIPESNIDKRLEVMSKAYIDFCKREKLVAVISKIDVFTFGGPGKERNGSWNKASVTSNLMLFLEDFCLCYADRIQEDETLKIFVPVLHMNVHDSRF